jgi:hypothetical protein
LKIFGEKVYFLFDIINRIINWWHRKRNAGGSLLIIGSAKQTSLRRQQESRSLQIFV